MAATDADSSMDVEGGAPTPTSAPRPSSRLNASQMLLLAQHWINMGEPGRAVDVFSDMPVGSASDPDVVRAFLRLTPHSSLPTTADMADEPGQAPLAVTAETIAKCVNALPRGRATGVDRIPYELITMTFNHGARRGWSQFMAAFGAGALGLVDAVTGALGLADAVCNYLRALMVGKDADGTAWRPLGLKSCLCRCGAMCVMICFDRPCLTGQI